MAGFVEEYYYVVLCKTMVINHRAVKTSSLKAGPCTTFRFMESRRSDALDVFRIGFSLYTRVFRNKAILAQWYPLPSGNSLAERIRMFYCARRRADPANAELT